jgi:hypothetical protein
MRIRRKKETMKAIKKIKIEALHPTIIRKFILGGVALFVLNLLIGLNLR